MKRGIQQANGNGVPLHRLKNADKILPLHHFQLIQRADAFLCCIGNHHFLHDRQAILLHKHMLRSAQSNALRPKIPSACSVRRGIRIGPNLHRCKCIRQHEKIPKIIGEFRLHQRKTPQRNDTEGSIQREIIPLLHRYGAHGKGLLIQVDLDRFGTGNTRFSKPARHYRSVARHSAMTGQNPPCRIQTVYVVRSRLRANEDNGLPFFPHRRRFIGIKYDNPHSRSGRRGKPFCQNDVFFIGVNLRMKQLLHLERRNARDRCFFIYGSCFIHFHCHPNSGGGSSLAAASL